VGALPSSGRCAPRRVHVLNADHEHVVHVAFVVVSDGAAPPPARGSAGNVAYGSLAVNGRVVSLARRRPPHRGGAGVVGQRGIVATAGHEGGERLAYAAHLVRNEHAVHGVNESVPYEPQPVVAPPDAER
jgi:hypothetical protein